MGRYKITGRTANMFGIQGGVGEDVELDLTDEEEAQLRDVGAIRPLTDDATNAEEAEATPKATPKKPAARTRTK